MTIVALEAAALGAPVLLTKQCDFDALEDAGGGLAVDASEDGLEHGLRTMLADPARLRETGRRASEFVSSHYRWSHTCDAFIAVFRAAVRGI
jgi:glycosyltransferase involved in cell wall biosynthesis